MKKLYWGILYHIMYFVLYRTYRLGNVKLSTWMTGFVLDFMSWNYKYIGCYDE